MATEFEEVVVSANSIRPQQTSPDLRDCLFKEPLRRVVLPIAVCLSFRRRKERHTAIGRTTRLRGSLKRQSRRSGEVCCGRIELADTTTSSNSVAIRYWQCNWHPG